MAIKNNIEIHFTKKTLKKNYSHLQNYKFLTVALFLLFEGVYLKNI